MQMNGKSKQNKTKHPKLGIEGHCSYAGHPGGCCSGSTFQKTLEGTPRKDCMLRGVIATVSHGIILFLPWNFLSCHTKMF